MSAILGTAPLRALRTTLAAFLTWWVAIFVATGPALSQPATLTPISGSGQSTTVDTLFGNPLTVVVQDASTAVLAGVPVTFTAPAGPVSSTATAIFNSAGNSITVNTDANGRATVPAAQLRSSQRAGQYNVSVTAGTANSTIILINAAGPAATISVSSGAGQSGVIGTDLPTPFTALVVDSFGNPAAGVGVTFTAPSSGASGNFSGSLTSLTTTNASGLATSAVFTTNTVANVYNVVANTTSAPLATPANFNLANLPGVATQISVNQGSGQSTQISTAFGTLLRALVRDANNNPVPGVTVTFTAPGTPATATFGGAPSITAVSDPSGFATATVLTASTVTGTYNVSATFTGGPTTNFSMTNTPGAAANLSINSGDGQSATITLNFASSLSIRLTDASNNPISGAVVSFAAPGAGASGLFGASTSTTATTNASGIATASTLRANTTSGTYNIVVTYLTFSVSFTLTNNDPSSITAVAGYGASAFVTKTFGPNMSALVVDSLGNGIPGLVVTFTAPSSGASGTFSGVATGITNASGVATAPTFTANANGGNYVVTARVAGVATDASFNLRNDTPSNIVVQGGSPQQTTINTAYPARLTARVTDGSGAGISGLVVTFAVPGSGASAAFAGGVTTATTNASGDAQSAVLTANGTVGSFTVNATVVGLATQAAFSLENLTPLPTTIAASPAGSATQSVAINGSFGTALGVILRDLNNVVVGNYPVTFTVVPGGTGASATFAGGSTTEIRNSSASGIATAPTLTANGIAGAFTVTAVANGQTFVFNLTNVAPSSITASAGTPQTTIINTNFGTLLRATVRDVSSNPIAGATVTFTINGASASGLFGAATFVTAVTDASGVATATSAITANGTVGAFTVSATVPSVAAATYNLTNTAPTSIAATGGTPQSRIVSTNFGVLEATVRDATSAVVAGAMVRFTAPSSGASGLFGGASFIDVVTNGSGIATATLTANAITGTFNVTASVAGVSPAATFTLNNIFATPASIVASPSNGTPQSTAVNTAFPNALGVVVRDAGGAIIVGIPVQFTINGTTASGTFPGGSTTEAVNTNASGIATAPALAANGTAGSYTVTALVGGLTFTFNLSNTIVPATISASGGNNQFATIAAAFTNPLQATVRNAGGSPVVGAVVVFSAPTTGARGTFAGSGATATATTDASGIATAPGFTAGTVAGSFQVSATVQGTAITTNFTLNNTSGVPSTITRVSGNNQSAALGADFGAPMIAVVRDASGNPVSGVSVTFNAPTTGARATFAGAATATVTTDASGNATSPTFTSTGTTGGYTIAARVNNTTPSVNFTANNTAAVPGSVVVEGGSPQATVVNTNFGSVLQARVLDTLGNAVSGVTVTFSVPTSPGASGAFSGAPSVTRVTNGLGVATSPVLRANTVSGTFFAQASVAGIVTPALYSMTNNPDTPVGITIVSGTPQTTIVTTNFAAPLVALVRDVYSNPVPGASVTFLAPTVGSVAAFPGPTNTVTVTTDTNGRATSPTLRANTIAGSYTVSASITTGSFVNFNLTNNPAPTSINATGAVTQSTVVSTGFGTALQVLVRDASNLPVPNVTITYTVPGSGASSTLSALTAVTDASGRASVTATANATTGSYVVTAQAAGLATVLSFNLTNTAGAATGITATGGSTQSTLVTTAFGTALQVTVRDTANNPVPGVVVTFAAPTSGASATLSSTTATTNAAGIASISITANATAGNYVITARVAGVPTVLSFNLTNTGTAGLTLTVASSRTTFTGPGQPVAFTYTVRNTGSLVATAVAVNDTKVPGITCPATTLAVNASMNCTATYVSTAADITGGSGITSVARVTASTAIGAAASSSVTTKVGIDIEAIRKQTVEANKGFMQNRAQALTSMAPNAQRLHNRLRSSIFGDVEEVEEVQPATTERHDPMKMVGTADAATVGRILPSIIGGPRTPSSSIGGNVSDGNSGDRLSGFGRDLTAGAHTGNGPSTIKLPFSFGGSADDGIGNFNFSTSLSQMREAARANDTAKAATAGNNGSSGVESRQAKRQDAIDVWFEVQSSYFTSVGVDGKRQGHAAVAYTGVDAIVAPGVSVGVLFQRDWMADSSSVAGRNRDGTGWMAGPYVGLRITPNVYFDARYARGTATNHVDPIGAYVDTFSSSRELFSARVTGAWKHGSWALKPSLEVTRFSELQKAYMNQIGIAIPETRVTLGRATFGPEVSYRLVTSDKSVFEPYIGLKANWDFEKERQLTATGAEAPADVLSARLEVGASYQMRNGIAIRGSGAVTGLGSDGYRAKQGQAHVIVPLR